MATLQCDLGVAARVVKDGLLLLVQEAHGRHQGLWGLPKGHVETNESPEEAVVRELLEETGMAGSVTGLAAVRTALHQAHPAVFLTYDMTLHAGKLQSQTEEIASTGWFSLVELNTLEWVSETMHQLSIDGLSHRRTMPPQNGLTARTAPYAIYRTSQTVIHEQEMSV